MKKRFLFAIIVCQIVAGKGYAQTTDIQTATLQHNGVSSVFYGSKALEYAYNQAVENDSILLSVGDFGYINVQKNNISIIGNGSTNKNGIMRTAIGAAGEQPDSRYGGFSVGEVDGVHIEGIYFYGNINLWADTISHLSVEKCIFQQLYCYNGHAAPVTLQDCSLKQCAFFDIRRYRDSGITANNLLISNCFVTSGIHIDTSSTIVFDHCILRCSTSFGGIDGSPTAANYLGGYYYTNNVIYGVPLVSAHTSHNVFVGYMFEGENSENDWNNVEETDIFNASLDELYSDDMDFSVKNTNYVGTDGTPVGVIGGTKGWSLVPSIPRITYSNLNTDNIKEGIIRLSLKAEAGTK